MIAILVDPAFGQNRTSEIKDNHGFSWDIMYKPLPEIEKSLVEELTKENLTDAQRRDKLQDLVTTLTYERAYERSISYYDQLSKLNEQLYGSESEITKSCYLEYASRLRRIGDLKKSAAMEEKGLGRSTEDFRSDRRISSTNELQSNAGFTFNTAPFRKEILSIISKVWNPPDPSAFVCLQVRFNSGGKVVKCEIFDSSDNKVVNQYAVETIQKLKFPPIPELGSTGTLVLQLNSENFKKQ